MTSTDPFRSELAHEEFRALRATIRERGTLRLLVVLITFVAWATLAMLAWRGGLSVSFGALATLVVLAGGFEIVFAIHVGVERIGRYLQARYERPAATLPRWEHDAMTLGQEPALRTGIDPLFSMLFAIAAILNLVPVLTPGVQWSVPIRAIPRGLAGLWVLVTMVAHVAFLIRIRRAKDYAKRQRQDELDWFDRQARESRVP